MMISSQCFICTFALLIYKVSPQYTVVGVIGGSALLPCNSNEDDLQVQECIVFWRHNGSNNVFDIIKGKDSFAEQDQEYLNRIESFPREYLRRNFSIKLNRLKQTDTGEFSCIITPTDEHKYVELIVKDAKSTVQDNKAEGEGETNVVESTSLLWLWILLAVSVGLAIGLIVLRLKKAKKFTHVDTDGDQEH